MIARLVPKGSDTLVPLDAPVGIPGKALFGAVLSLGQGIGVRVPDIDLKEPLSGAKAMKIGGEVLGKLFAGLQDVTT